VRTIWAIDPGTTESALVIMHDGCPGTHHIAQNLDVLGWIHSEFHPHDSLVVEMVQSFGMPVGSEVFETCVWIGRFVQAAHCRSTLVEYHLIPRGEIKMHLCQHTKGVDDAVIRQAMIDRFGPGKEKAIGNKKAPGPLYGFKGDEWQALAVGCVAWDKEQARQAAL
jgi:hypothetical protein